jgi:hypothetical protein
LQILGTLRHCPPVRHAAALRKYQFLDQKDWICCVKGGGEGGGARLENWGEFRKGDGISLLPVSCFLFFE